MELINFYYTCVLVIVHLYWLLYTLGNNNKKQKETIKELTDTLYDKNSEIRNLQRELQILKPELTDKNE